MLHSDGNLKERWEPKPGIGKLISLFVFSGVISSRMKNPSVTRPCIVWVIGIDRRRLGFGPSCSEVRKREESPGLSGLHTPSVEWHGGAGPRVMVRIQWVTRSILHPFPPGEAAETSETYGCDQLCWRPGTTSRWQATSVPRSWSCLRFSVPWGCWVQLFSSVIFKRR